VKSSRGWILVIAVELVAVCGCLALLSVLAVSITLLSAPEIQSAQAVPSETAMPSDTPTRAPTRTPAATEMPAPTYTRVLPPPPADLTVGPFTVVSRTPTRAPVAYNIFVPTPTAPRMAYPVAFNSDFKVVTYTVTGKTLNELLGSLNAQAMPDPNESTGRYFARTDWYISTQSSTQPTTRGCEVGGGAVSVAMTMTLPMLSSTTGTSPDVLNHWATFISNTITHETGHITRTLQGARDYQRDLGNMPPASDCTTLKPQLSDLFDRATSTIRKSNIDYDAATQHGAKQGAVFP